MLNVSASHPSNATLIDKTMSKAMNTIKYPRVFLGISVEDESIYLSPPSWDCNWYWGWGYIGNKSCHHLSSLFEKTDMHTGIKQHFKTFTITNDKDLWTFCELVRTFYHLRETSNVLTRGGSHYTKNPCQELIEDADYAKHINTVLMPAIFSETYKLLGFEQPKPNLPWSNNAKDI